MMSTSKLNKDNIKWTILHFDEINTASHIKILWQVKDFRCGAWLTRLHGISRFELLHYPFITAPRPKCKFLCLFNFGGISRFELLYYPFITAPRPKCKLMSLFNFRFKLLYYSFLTAPRPKCKCLGLFNYRDLCYCVTLFDCAQT